MASNSYSILAFFIAVSLMSSMDISQAARNLLQTTPAAPTLPKLPPLPMPTIPTTLPQPQGNIPPLPTIPFPSLPTFPTVPQMTLPPLPNIQFPTIPTTMPFIPFLSPPPSTSTTTSP